ncbi:MAG: hypothetical protein U1F43_23720 [Myxococcota bacterium]
MARAYPCDGLVVDADEPFCRAVSVDAPPDVLFRWLCQLRAAPYSYDWIDNLGRRSPRTLTPGLEELAHGQRVMTIFRLESFETDAHLTMRMSDRRSLRLFGDIALTYAVLPGAAPGAPAPSTRLVAKFVVRYPRTLVGRVMRHVLPLGDLVMMRRQLLTLKALAEATTRAARATPERPGRGQRDDGAAPDPGQRRVARRRAPGAGRRRRPRGGHRAHRARWASPRAAATGTSPTATSSSARRSTPGRRRPR